MMMLNNESVLHVIRDVLEKKDADIKDIKRVGGLTNINFSVTVDDEKFILRLPGDGTEELVNRQAEKNNLIFATSLGINPELVYFNDQTNMKITRKIPNPSTLTAEQTKHPQKMNQIIDIFHKLHYASHGMSNRFELFTLMQHYETLVEKIHPIEFQHYTAMKKDIAALKEVYESLQVEEAPCHIDTISDNFVSSGMGKVYLIDWEYSGMFDPMWDVATLMLNSDYTEAEEQLFLQKYFERQPTEEEIQRIHLHKIFQDYLWSLWGVYKVASGDTLDGYATGLFNRAVKNLTTYKAIYEEQAV